MKHEEIIKGWVPKHDRITIKSVGDSYRVNLYNRTGDVIKTYKMIHSYFLTIVDDQVKDITR